MMTARRPAHENPTALRKRIGKRVRLARDRNGLDQKELADIIGFTVQGISVIETGTSGPSLDTLCRLAETLGVPVSFFFAEEVEDDPDLLEVTRFIQGMSPIERQSIRLAVEFVLQRRRANREAERTEDGDNSADQGIGGS